MQYIETETIGKNLSRRYPAIADSVGSTRLRATQFFTPPVRLYALYSGIPVCVL